MLDDPTRRLLRFSLFLQGFAALMMGAAFVIRAAAIGWDAVTFVLAAVRHWPSSRPWSSPCGDSGPAEATEDIRLSFLPDARLIVPSGSL